MRTRFLVVVSVASAAGAACAPPAALPLPGAAAPPAALPAGQLPPGHRLLAFRWEFREQSSLTRGEGAVRLAPPDSARLDFFLAGGIAHGAAVLIGDSLRVNVPEAGRRLIPPPPMLWAALGRLAVSALPDTVVTTDADLVRGAIGRDPQWRATFVRGQLMHLERVSGGRITEVVNRTLPDVLYQSHVAPRRFSLTIIRDQPSPPFDAAIWAP